MTQVIEETVEKLNRVKRQTAVFFRMIALLRALVFALIVSGCWEILNPGHDQAYLALFLLSFITTLLFSVHKPAGVITANDFKIALEMKYPRLEHSILNQRDFIIDPPEWQGVLRTEVDDLKQFEKTRRLQMASTLIIPLLFFAMTATTAPKIIKVTLNNVSNVVARLTMGATLQVLEGKAEAEMQDIVSLSTRKPLRIELLEQNMVKIEFTGVAAQKINPVVELKTQDESGNFKSFQTFQLSAKKIAHADQSTNNTYNITFSIGNDVSLFLEELSSSEPVAFFKVRQLPVPKVALTITDAAFKEPWPDDRPLPLIVSASGENALKIIQLIIISGNRTSKELVSNIMAEDKHRIEVEYNLILEPYVENDVAEVEIIAEAIDRNVPTPLVGRSSPLKIKTASAYGRYRQTLQTLHQLKTMVDQAVADQKQQINPDAGKLMNSALEQSEESPFFDQIDRVNLQNFKMDLNLAVSKKSQEHLLQLSGDLNRFLFEHEVLDDKERDRDFFVAIRGLSRLLEQDRSSRQIKVPTVTERIKKFVDERMERWRLRVEHLPKAIRPKEWTKIAAEKPFHKALNAVEKFDAEQTKQSDANALSQLSKTSSEYREWIENLEKIEDQYRTEQEQKRQEGLASAAEQLKDLQKRQTEISTILDRSDERKPEELADKWPSTRMLQNTNIDGTKKLEGQLRSIAPSAGERIRAALEAMEMTTKSGNDSNFTVAESASDLSGRLLRQAESATRKEQQNSGNRGRRRRVTGDNYYGQSIVGGDIEIKRDYQVDKRYREDILDDVRRSLHNNDSVNADEDRTVLENYLRQVVR